MQLIFTLASKGRIKQIRRKNPFYFIFDTYLIAMSLQSRNYREFKMTATFPAYVFEIKWKEMNPGSKETIFFSRGMWNP
jgi:hypothetical protein